MGVTDRKERKDEQRITVRIVTCALQRILFGRSDEGRHGQNEKWGNRYKTVIGKPEDLAILKEKFGAAG